MGNSVVTFDMSTAKPIDAEEPSATPQQALQGAVSFAAQQSPDHYAKLLKFQQVTGIPPVVSKGNEEQVKQAVDAQSIDPHFLTQFAPKTSAWATNPDNAAVSGVDEIHRLAGIEQNAGAMRAVPSQTDQPYSPWQDIKSAFVDAIAHPVETLVGADTPQDAAAKQASIRHVAEQTGDPFLRGVSNTQEFLQKPLLSVSGTTSFQKALNPNSQNLFSRAITGGTKAIEALSSPDNLGLLATMSLAPADAGALISGVFTTQMAAGSATEGYGAIRAAYNGQYGDAAEKGASAIISAAFAASSGKHALADNLAKGMAPQQVSSSPFLDNLSQAIDASDASKLRERAPDKFYEATQAHFEGDAGLRIPSDAFSDYFKSKGIDPATLAQELGATNYTEAVLSGGDVQIPPADFLSKLDSEHQKGLQQDIVDPATGMTARQHQDSREDLQQWVASGGADKMVADAAAVDAETASSPEFEAVKEDFRHRYVDAGETPEVADTLAEKDANAYSNIAKSAGLKTSELIAMYNPKVVTEDVREGFTLNQDVESEAPKGWGVAESAGTRVEKRGWMRVLPDGTIEMGRTKFGNMSTFAHESSHAYLHILNDLATKEGASEILKSDHAKIMDWLGVKPGESLTREQHETWARANEQYLREGKAPSAKLRGVFQRFGVWLQSVYKKASDLGVELNDNIRGVLDRLYASEDGVNRAAAEAGPKMFSSAEEAGWTEEQFQNYAESRNVSIEDAKAHVLSKLNEARLQESTDAWKSEESNVRAAITSEVDQSRAYSAIRALRKGAMDDGTDLSLSREELVKQFGEQRVKELQKQHPGMYRNEGGVEPETAAEILGFDSAESMMKTLETSPRRSAAIEQGTRDYMTAKHGDIRYDGTLPDQARLALENDKRADGLHKELSALRRQVEKLKADDVNRKIAARSVAVAPIEAYRETARISIEGKAIADLQPNRYLDASRKYSRESFDAMRKGDPWEAAQAKHKELLNHFLFREAAKAKEYIGKFDSYVKRVQSKGIQAKLGLAGSDFRDQFNRLLSRYGLAEAPTGAPARTLAAWASDLYEQGTEPAIDASMYDETRAIHYRQASVAEVRNLHEALINIRHLASQELGMEVNGRKVEFNAAMENMSAQARESIKSKPRPVLDENRTAGMKAEDLVNRGTALLARTEFLMKRLDGGDSGPWHDNLWHLAADSQGRESELQEEVTKRVGDALQNIPKEQLMKLLDKVSIEGINEPVTRKSMLAMAFNMGNEGNLNRLEKTFVAHGWDPRAIEAVKGKITREEWKFVQDGWDSLKPLGQAQSELEKRLTGLPPIMVKPEPFSVELADGSKMDLDGGYYPVVMDPRFSARGAQQDAGQTAQNLMESGYGRAATSRGNMKERTGFGGPLQLDYEQVLTQHTAKVIKDISHREFMLTANKLLMDPQIRQTLRDTLGEGNEAQMMPWLRTIINDRNGSAVQGLGDLSNLMNRARTNVVKAALGFKFSTVLLQLTHASSILLHTSPGSYAQAMIDFLAHPNDMSDQIRGLSPNEMSARGENIDRDMRKVLQGGIEKKSIGDLWSNLGMKPVQLMDHVLSFPLWLSVYRDALAENTHLGESEAKYQAMHKADGAVRMGLGSNAPKDLAPIMRKNDLTKLLTTMGGFHNLKWNQMADVASQFGRDRNVGNLTYGMLMAAVIPSIMGPLITSHGPKDGENKGAWAAKRALLFPAETMAVVNIAVEAMENGGDIRFSPIVSTMERAAKAGVNSTAEKEDKDWTGIGMDALQSAMDFYGVSGTDQGFKTLRYGRKAQQGQIDNPNVFDAVAGQAPVKK